MGVVLVDWKLHLQRWASSPKRGGSVCTPPPHLFDRRKKRKNRGNNASALLMGTHQALDVDVEFCDIPLAGLPVVDSLIENFQMTLS